LFDPNRSYHLRCHHRYASAFGFDWLILIFHKRVLGGKFARKHVPLNLRQILSAESAANDGMAYPFLTIALYLTLDRTTGEAFTHWVLIGCLCMSILIL